MLGKNATTPVLRWDDLIIDQDESEEGRDCLYKSGGAVSWGHFVALPLCVLGQFSRITSAVMRRRRHHQTSSRRGEKEARKSFIAQIKKCFTRRREEFTVEVLFSDETALRKGYISIKDTIYTS